MSEGAFADFEDDPKRLRFGARVLATRALPGILMLVSSGLLGVWVIAARQTSPALPGIESSIPETKPYGELVLLPPESSRGDSIAALASDGETEILVPFVQSFPANPYGSLAGLSPSLGLRPSLDLDMESAPAPAGTQVAAAPPLTAPLPPRRPVDFGVLSSPAASPAPPLVARETPPTTQNAPGFFARLFSGLQAPQGQAVAYANSETTTVPRSSSPSAVLRSAAPWGQPSGLARYDKFTAVYDIEAKTVYLPNGARLEAHSGLGDLKDDPKHVDAHARGATPPDVYELGLREGLFHGVQALRLKPVGSGEQFGRTGLLAHPYMLGAEGDSFGCVSFKDYDAFLQAFQSGQVKKLAVVAKLD